jgi:hypothetical protein
LDNEHYQNWMKLGQGLASRQMEKGPFVMIKKILAMLLAVSVVIILTLAAANAMGMKSPSYVQGYESGYRASYQAAFDDNYYNVKAGLGQESGYNEGYQHGYDEGYPAGQLDRKNRTLDNIKTVTS